MNHKKRLDSPLLYVLPAAALAVAGCVTGGGHDPGPAADASSLRLFDPVSGLTFSLPCTSCGDGQKRASAERALERARATPESTVGPAAVVRQEAPPPTPRHAVMTVEQPIMPMSAQREVKGAAETGSAEAAPSAPPPALKLDTEFASVARIVPFALGRSSAGPIGRKAIAELVPMARQAEKIYIRGRTDALGDQAANRTLAMARAAAVRSGFLAAGVERKKMHTTYCTTCYVAPNNTEQGRRSNRRVDVELLMPRDLIAKLPKPVHAPEPPAEQPLKLSAAR